MSLRDFLLFSSLCTSNQSPKDTINKNHPMLSVQYYRELSHGLIQCSSSLWQVSLRRRWHPLIQVVCMLLCWKHSPPQSLYLNLSPSQSLCLFSITRLSTSSSSINGAGRGYIFSVCWLRLPSVRSSVLSWFHRVMEYLVTVEWLQSSHWLFCPSRLLGRLGRVSSSEPVTKVSLSFLDMYVSSWSWCHYVWRVLHCHIS